MSASPSRVAVIGFGAMARSLAARLALRPDGPRVIGALLRPESQTPLPAGLTRFRDTAALSAARPDLVVECAGHGAVANTVPALLSAGIDVALVSIGALCDDVLRARLTQAAHGGGRLILTAGAVGGLDLLRAARGAGIDRVSYRGVKPPRAWFGSAAEDRVDLRALERPAVLYQGSARTAATLFPKNANVAAAIALAGIGLDATQVTLVADPKAGTNRHEITARGDFGEMTFTVANAPLPDNPKTSYLAALSAEAAVTEALLPLQL